MKHVIPSEGAAQRIAEEARRGGKETTVFQYEQPRTRLTLFGVSVREPDGSEHEIRFQ